MKILFIPIKFALRILLTIIIGFLSIFAGGGEWTGSDMGSDNGNDY